MAYVPYFIGCGLFVLAGAFLYGSVHGFRERAPFAGYMSGIVAAITAAAAVLQLFYAPWGRDYVIGVLYLYLLMAVFITCFSFLEREVLGVFFGMFGVIVTHLAIHWL